MNNTIAAEKILAIDIGGSNIKAILLNKKGEALNSYQKIPTPENGGPQEVLDAILKLTQDIKNFDAVSVGFPGYVKKGVVYTAPNLGTEKWNRVPFCEILMHALKKPVQLLNDADIQGFGVIKGDGMEIVVTLGTGFGTALFYDGQLLPHLELAHHPVAKKKTYDQYIGDEALEDVGEEKWNERIKKVIGILKTVFNYDHLYIGGGNAKKIDFKLDDNITIVNNQEGIKGGTKLWQ
ncbi:MAG: ROK family protein [Ilyomonas sp.]